MEAAEPQLILDRGVALIISRVTGVERDLHVATSLLREAVSIPAIRFGLNEVPCGLSRQQPDQIDEAWIGLRRRRHSRFAGRVGDHTKLFGCCTSRSRHDRVLVLARNTPLRDNDAK
jgi:hypothetical protein